MIYKKLNLTFADSIRIHYPIKYRRPCDVPIKLDVQEHGVKIIVFADFSENMLTSYKPYVRPFTIFNASGADDDIVNDSLLSSKPDNFTFADAVEEGVKKNWEGSFNFPWYGHDASGEIPVTVEFIRKGSNQAAKYPNQRFVRINQNGILSKSSYVISSMWRWGWGVFKNKTIESLSLNWSPYHPGKMCIRRYKLLYTYEQVAAHEFGHLLGLGDAYGAPYRLFYQADNTVSYMMCHNRKVQNQELEMALRAHLLGSMQYFPVKFSIKNVIRGMKQRLG